VSGDCRCGICCIREINYILTVRPRINAWISGIKDYQKIFYLNPIDSSQEDYREETSVAVEDLKEVCRKNFPVLYFYGSTFDLVSTSEHAWRLLPENRLVEGTTTTLTGVVTSFEIRVNDESEAKVREAAELYMIWGGCERSEDLNSSILAMAILDDDAGAVRSGLFEVGIDYHQTFRKFEQEIGQNENVLSCADGEDFDYRIMVRDAYIPEEHKDRTLTELGFIEYVRFYPGSVVIVRTKKGATARENSCWYSLWMFIHLCILALSVFFT